MYMPWITSFIQKSVSIKNHYLSIFIKLEDPHIRMEAQNKYKKCRYLILTLPKRSKQSYFTNFFQENIKDLKNTWKGIKNISLKHSNQNHLMSLLVIMLL